METHNSDSSASPTQAGRQEIGFDLGTLTGVYQREYPGGPLRSWTTQLATEEELERQRREGRERTLDIRFERFFKLLLDLVAAGKPTDIYWEDPPCKSSGLQCQFLGSLRSAAWAVGALHPGVRLFCVPVATLKKFATGNGHAQKADMAAALASRRPNDYKLVEGDLIQKSDGTFADHNEVDAIWLALYADSVRRGERSFESAYQRKQKKIAKRREKKAQRKLNARLKKAANIAQAKAKQRALRLAIKSLGTCCGVFRKQSQHSAICPKCGSQLPLPKIHTPVLATAVNAPSPIQPAPDQPTPEKPALDLAKASLPAPESASHSLTPTPKH